MGIHYNIIPVTTGDFTHTNMKFFQNTLRIHGRILWHIPVTTDDFILDTGHDWRLYTRLPQLWEGPQNTLKIHGRVLWHIPVTTDDFILDTGHDRRLYTRLPQLWEGPQNTLKIHGRVLWHKPVTTDDFINDTGHYRRLYTRLYTIMWGSLDYTKNTRSCIMTYTDHDRWLC